jgi:hypothetical protein
VIRIPEGRVGDIMDIATDTKSKNKNEGVVASAIERQTAKVPSDVFLWSALGAIGLSLGLAIAKQGKASTFVGQWVPTLLLFGVYNKIVKVSTSDGVGNPLH